MRKIALFSMALMFGGFAFAGLDMFTGKTKTTLLNPDVLTAGVAYTNSEVTGVDVVGFPGNGVLVLAYDATQHAEASVSFVVKTCATTNGTYATATLTGQTAFTNAAGFTILPYKPVNNSRYVRVIATPSAAASNAVAGAVLLTE